MGVFKRGEVYYFRFRFKGRQIKRAVGRVTRKLAKLAEEEERKRRAAAYVAGRWGTPAGQRRGEVPTLKAYVSETYLPLHLPQIAATSRVQLRSLATKLARVLGDYRLDALTPAVLDRYAAARLEPALVPETLRQAYAAARLGKVSPAQVVNDMRALAQILNHARRQGVLGDQPMRGWKWPKADESAFHIVTPSEERRLLAAAAPLGFRPWIRLGLDTGLRKGELRRLERPHVDRARSELRLPQPKVRGRFKVIPLAPDTLRLLRQLERRDTPYLLARADGQPHGINRIDRLWARTRRRAGLRGIRFHDLRHTFATRALEAGASVPEVGEMLGHKPPLYKQTWRYVHALEAGKRRAILRMAGTRSGTNGRPGRARP